VWTNGASTRLAGHSAPLRLVARCCGPLRAWHSAGSRRPWRAARLRRAEVTPPAQTSVTSSSERASRPGNAPRTRPEAGGCAMSVGQPPRHPTVRSVARAAARRTRSATRPPRPAVLPPPAPQKASSVGLLTMAAAERSTAVAARCRRTARRPVSPARASSAASRAFAPVVPSAYSSTAAAVPAASSATATTSASPRHRAPNARHRHMPSRPALTGSRMGRGPAACSATPAITSARPASGVSASRTRPVAVRWVVIRLP
jgi:hypothetical protein